MSMLNFCINRKNFTNEPKAVLEKAKGNLRLLFVRPANGDFTTLAGGVDALTNALIPHGIDLFLQLQGRHRHFGTNFHKDEFFVVDAFEAGNCGMIEKIRSNIMGKYWYKNAIIYSTHIETFMDSNGDGVGDFIGMSRSLDYLAGLGVTCIWLLPFFPSPNRDHGYRGLPGRGSNSER